jgi:hypothetical protein
MNWVAYQAGGAAPMLQRFEAKWGDSVRRMPSASLVEPADASQSVQPDSGGSLTYTGEAALEAVAPDTSRLRCREVRCTHAAALRCEKPSLVSPRFGPGLAAAMLGAHAPDDETGSDHALENGPTQ